MARTLIDHIIAWIGENQVTSKEIVQEFGGRYHCNAAHHIGAAMSRAVNAGKIIRIKKGVFKVNFNYTGRSVKKDYGSNENQGNLFS